MLDTYRLTFDTTGGAGASASAALTVPYGKNVTTRALSGKVMSIYVKYGGSNASTTDVAIKTLGLNGPAQTILTLTNLNTDALFYPRIAACDSVGAAVTFDGTHAQLIPAVVDDYIAVTVAQGNDKTIDVWITVEC